MSSKRRLRRKACQWKVRHSTEDEAQTELERIKQQRRRQEGARRRQTGIGSMGGRWLQVYKCGFCSGFHVGHPPAEVKRAMARRREGVT